MEFIGTYGGSFTPCKIYQYKSWYVVEGSCNVNATHQDLFDGVDIEELEDFDKFTNRDPIDSMEDLIDAVNS